MAHHHHCRKSLLSIVCACVILYVKYLKYANGNIKYLIKISRISYLLLCIFDYLSMYTQYVFKFCFILTYAGLCNKFTNCIVS